MELLNISFYATDPASFAQATGADGALFDTIVEGVTELARRRPRGGYPRRLRTSFICTKDNLHLVPEFIRLSEKMGVDAVKLRNLRFHGIPGLPESKSLNAGDPEVEEFLDSLRRQRFQVPVYLPRLPRRDDRRKCDQPFRLVAIDGDGFIGPCCCKADQCCWGNLTKQANPWNGPAMLRARRWPIWIPMRRYPPCAGIVKRGSRSSCGSVSDPEVDGKGASLRLLMALSLHHLTLKLIGAAMTRQA